MSGVSEVFKEYYIDNQTNIYDKAYSEGLTKLLRGVAWRVFFGVVKFPVGEEWIKSLKDGREKYQKLRELFVISFK